MLHKLQSLKGDSYLMHMQAAVMHACLSCTAAHPAGRSQGCLRRKAVLMHMPAQPALRRQPVWQEGDMLRIDLQRSTSGSTGCLFCCKARMPLC